LFEDEGSLKRVALAEKVVSNDPKTGGGRRVAIDLEVDAGAATIAARSDRCSRQVLDELLAPRVSKQPFNERAFLLGQCPRL
jgi:hypothetical protein